MAQFAIASSPLSSAPSTQSLPLQTSSQQIKHWKSARELPFELAQHVQIYFEESMFMQAYRLLLSIATSDASSQKGVVTVPPPAYLALTATLIVHPTLTTRTTLAEKWEQANSGLRLLRLLQRITGPVHCRFRQAFAFTKYDYGAKQDDNSDHPINHVFAQDDSIWNRADDFWAVVGWAFNCSCLPGMYSSRWEHWNLWLEFMVDVLETDWQYHANQDSSEESLLWQYIETAVGGNVRARRIMRAVFTDGSTKSLNEFREVFRRELKEPKTDTDKSKKREAVDIDKEIYGDYLVPDDSDESSDNEPRAQKRIRTRAPAVRHATPRASNQSLRSEFDTEATSPTTATATTSSSMPALGPPSSVTLRLRLLQLLATLASHPTLTQTSPTTFPDPTDLYTLFVEFIKPLPLSVFQTFTIPGSLPPTTHHVLQTFLLQRLLETSPPTTHLLHPHLLTPSVLQTSYLPHAASKATADANARVSLCLEGLLRGLVKEGRLKQTQALREAMEKGVERRTSRVRERSGRGRGAESSVEDDEAWALLVESGARIKAVVARLGE